MRASRIVVSGVASAVLLTLAWINSAARQETLVANYGEVRTVLAFKLSDAAVQKLLPKGFRQAGPVAAGPAQGANLNLNVLERRR